MLGRFLEHSRIFWFENAGDPEVWIGSADLMHRNLDRRVEALVRLPGELQVEEIGRLLDLAFDDGTASWWLQESGRGSGMRRTPRARRCATCRSC